MGIVNEKKIKILVLIIILFIVLFAVVPILIYFINFSGILADLRKDSCGSRGTDGFR